MVEETKTYYYSRRKLGMYLLFNLGLMALAILFTWSIFPNYQPVYYFALTTCSLSILSSLLVFCIKMPLAVTTDEYIKIDRNHPLKWTQIKKIETISFSTFCFTRTALKIIPKNIKNYKMGIMQKLIKNSQFGAFSIPLYAMSDYQAKNIEKTIQNHLQMIKHKTITSQKKKI